MATTTNTRLTHHSAVTVEKITLFAGWMLGSFLGALALWVLVPAALLGWDPLLITSGSMEPLISIGDVVLIDPDHGLAGPDSVVAYQSGDEVVLHRVVSVDPDGALVTKGDDNPRRDSGVVAQDDLLGVGRLLVPFIGLIRVVNWVWLAAAGTLVVGTLVAMRDRPVFSVSGLVVASLLASSTGVAAFAAMTSNTGSSANAIDLAAPTNVSAACGAIGAGSVDVDLTWTASSTAGLDGYRIYHDGPEAGTDFSEVGTTSATSFTHQISAPLEILGTHTYMVRSYLGSWESEDSNTDSVTVTQLVAYVCTEN